MFGKLCGLLTALHLLSCRRGTADLLQNLQDSWPSLPKQTDGKLRDEESRASIQVPDYTALQRFRICGDHIPRQEWVNTVFHY